MIYFDLDGVIRDLCKVTPYYPQKWDSTFGGLTLVEYFNKYKHLLIEAPATEYFSTIEKYFAEEITIITSQQKGWEIFAEKWLEIYFIDTKVNIIYDTEKLYLLKNNDFLVEDYPKYNDYSQIVLIDRPYNREVVSPYLRIHSPQELEIFFKRSMNE